MSEVEVLLLYVLTFTTFTLVNNLCSFFPTGKKNWLSLSMTHSTVIFTSGHM